MQASDKIKEFISKEEGCRLLAYKPLPTDRWTIGYGTTYYSPTKPVKAGDVITKDLALDLLNKHIDDVADGLNINHYIPNNVTQNQFDAVVSLVYNIGLPAFNKSQTGKLFYAGMNISEKFLLWDKSNGEIIPGLIARREKEQKIYDNSSYVA